LRATNNAFVVGPEGVSRNAANNPDTPAIYGEDKFKPQSRNSLIIPDEMRRSQFVARDPASSAIWSLTLTDGSIQKPSGFNASSAFNKSN